MSDCKICKKSMFLGFGSTNCYYCDNAFCEKCRKNNISECKVCQNNYCLKCIDVKIHECETENEEETEEEFDIFAQNENYKVINIEDIDWEQVLKILDKESSNWEVLSFPSTDVLILKKKGGK